jgi:hypothetical protein
MIGNKTDRSTQIYRYILDGLRNDNALKDIVPADNFVDFTRGRVRPYNSQFNPSDFPVFELIPVGGEQNFHWTSSSTSEMENFELTILTGSMQIADDHDNQNLLNPLRQHVRRALFQLSDKAKLYFLPADYGFSVVSIAVTDLVINITDQNKGHEGWFMVWSIRANLSVPRDLSGVE